MRDLSKLFRKTIQKSLFLLRNLEETSKNHLGMFDAGLVVFEGGLGSQLFAYFEMLTLESEGVQVTTNLDYFVKREEKSLVTLENRSWSLDRYGITIESIAKSSETSKVSKQMPLRFRYEINPKRFNRYMSLKLNSYFNLETLKAKEFLRSFSISNDFYAIHLRRGDYLNISSKVITDEEVLSISNQVFRLLDKAPIFVFSDSPIEDQFLHKLRVISNSQVFAIESTSYDEMLCHDLMRMAKVLILSNSSYSLSAAIIAREQQLSILPLEFYSGYQEENLNRTIQKLCNFMILSRD